MQYGLQVQDINYINATGPSSTQHQCMKNKSPKSLILRKSAPHKGHLLTNIHLQFDQQKRDKSTKHLKTILFISPSREKKKKQSINETTEPDSTFKKRPLLFSPMSK